MPALHSIKHFTTEAQRAQRKLCIVNCAVGAVNKVKLCVLCASVVNGLLELREQIKRLPLLIEAFHCL